MFNIAFNTFREILRNRSVSLIIILQIVFIGVLFFLNTLALDTPALIIPDFWLGFIELSGLFIILFLGNRLISREFEERTFYLTLSRPITRPSIIFGKFMGFSLIIGILVMIESVILIGIMHFFAVDITPIFLSSLLAIFLKLLITTILILFFSVFLSSPVATFLTLAFYIIGQSGYALLEYGMLHENASIEWFAKGILLLFPDFFALNTKQLIHLPNIPHFSEIFLGYGINICYWILLLLLTAFIFSRRSFDSL